MLRAHYGQPASKVAEALKRLSADGKELSRQPANSLVLLALMLDRAGERAVSATVLRTAWKKFRRSSRDVSVPSPQEIRNVRGFPRRRVDSLPAIVYLCIVSLGGSPARMAGGVARAWSASSHEPRRTPLRTAGPRQTARARESARQCDERPGHAPGPHRLRGELRESREFRARRR
jgi:hypothetical protein